MSDIVQQLAQKIETYLREESPSHVQLLDFMRFALREVRSAAFKESSETVSQIHWVTEHEKDFCICTSIADKLRRKAAYLDRKQIVI